MLDEAQLEIAAREYCRLLGLDPNEQVFGGHELHSTLGLKAPRWKFAVRLIRNQVAMQMAVEFARSH